MKLKFFFSLLVVIVSVGTVSIGFANSCYWYYDNGGPAIKVTFQGNNSESANNACWQACNKATNGYAKIQFSSYGKDDQSCNCVMANTAYNPYNPNSRPNFTWPMQRICVTSAG